MTIPDTQLSFESLVTLSDRAGMRMQEEADGTILFFDKADEFTVEIYKRPGQYRKCVIYSKKNNGAGMALIYVDAAWSAYETAREAIREIELWRARK